MPYIPNIPQAANIPSQSQPLILGNFTTLDTTFGYDHYEFSDAALGGRHRATTFEFRPAPPLTSPTQIALYAKDVGLGVIELFYKRMNEGTEVQMTNAAVPTIGTAGQTFLPGGLILKFNQFTFNGAATTQAFPVGAFPNAALCVVISPFNLTAAQSFVYVSTWTAANVTVNALNPHTNMQVTYMAIGH